jgi:hypothetical protein
MIVESYGVHVPRHVVVVYWQEIDHVTVHHLQMVVPIVKETTMKRHCVLQPPVQVYIIIRLFACHFTDIILKQSVIGNL